MGRFWLIFFILNILVTAAALISCLSSEEPEIRAMPRIVWVIVILLFSPIGAIVWFFAGKEKAGGPRQMPQAPYRQIAPDDDPDFLRKLREQREEEKRRKRDEPDDSSDT